MFITAPAGLTDGQKIFYNITADSYQPANLGLVNPPLRSATQAAVDAPVNKGTNPMTRYVVLADAHGNGGDADRDGKYAVIAKDGNGNSIGFRAQSMAVSIVKTATVTDKAGGSQPASGATVHYTLSVSTAGAGTAFGVIVTDPVPAGTTYTSGTLRLNGTLLSDAADSDAGDMGGTTPGIVTMRLGDVSSASPAQLITFDVKID
jgi:conserved repeat domain